MKRRKLYDGDEHVFWHEVEALQEQQRALENVSVTPISSAADTLITIQEAWQIATQEERRELVQMVLQEVGCDIISGQIIWVKPRPGFEILFQLVVSVMLLELGRFGIRDIEGSKGN